MQEFPFFEGRGIEVTRGTGRGFAEFVPPDERGNPIPGRSVVQIRPKSFGLPQGELESVVLGDMLHAAPALSSEFAELKKQLTVSLLKRPEQRQLLVEMHEDDKARSRREGLPERSFEQFLEVSAVDAFIRDFFFRRRQSSPGGRGFVSGLGPVMDTFFPEQIPILRGMEDIVTGAR